MYLKSTFALLDVKRGRVALRKALERGEGPFEVTIKGRITEVFGHDDGESQEFVLEVDAAIVRD